MSLDEGCNGIQFVENLVLEAICSVNILKFLSARLIIWLCSGFYTYVVVQMEHTTRRTGLADSAEVKASASKVHSLFSRPLHVFVLTLSPCSI